MCVFQGVCGDYTHRVSERVSCKKLLYTLLCNIIKEYFETSRIHKHLYVILLCFNKLSFFNRVL